MKCDRTGSNSKSLRVDNSSSDCQPKLENVLRGDQIVPVIRNNSLEGNTVQVHYETDKNGLVDPNSIHIKAGPSARNIDVMLHDRTVSRLKRYSGLLGEVIKLKNQIKKLLG